jgi:hypothetical protein
MIPISLSKAVRSAKPMTLKRNPNNTKDSFSGCFCCGDPFMIFFLLVPFFRMAIDMIATHGMTNVLRAIKFVKNH